MKKVILVLMTLLIGLSIIFAISIRGDIGKDGYHKWFKSTDKIFTIHSVKKINSSFDADNLIFDVDAEKINLEGNNTNSCNLQIDYYEVAKGDVKFYFDGSNFKFKSSSDKGVCIKSISGTIPNKLKLKIDNGTGSILLKKYTGKSIVIDNGTGKIIVNDTNGLSLDIDNGTGNIILGSNHLKKFLAIDNGTGNIRITDNICDDNITIDNGVGNVIIDGAISQKTSIDNGTGNIIIQNSKIFDVDANTGIGNIKFENNSFNSKKADTGIGNVSDVNSARISY